jgi:hypothetical protein
MTGESGEKREKGLFWEILNLVSGTVALPLHYALGCL